MGECSTHQFLWLWQEGVGMVYGRGDGDLRVGLFVDKSAAERIRHVLPSIHNLVEAGMELQICSADQCSSEILIWNYTTSRQSAFLTSSSRSFSSS